MKLPGNLKYSRTHEWSRLEADGSVTVGITDHAQEMLGDIVFVELPEIGGRFAAGAQCAVVESVKAAADVYAPLAGEIIATNTALGDAPQLVNQDAYGAWFFRMRPESPAALEALLDAREYADFAAAK